MGKDSHDIELEGLGGAVGVSFVVALAVYIVTQLLSGFRASILKGVGYSSSNMKLVAYGEDWEPEGWESGDWRMFLFTLVLLLLARASTKLSGSGVIAWASAIGLLLGLHGVEDSILDISTGRVFFYFALALIGFLAARAQSFRAMIVPMLVMALAMRVSGGTPLIEVEVRGATLPPGSAVIYAFVQYAHYCSWVVAAAVVGMFAASSRSLDGNPVAE